MTSLPPAIEIALAAIVITAAVFDLRTRKIPNWLSAVGVCAGIVLNTAVLGLPGLLRAVLGLALAFSVYFLFFALRAMGAGDVKLMAAVGALSGAYDWFIIFIITAIAGGVLAAAMLLWHGGAHDTFGRVLKLFRSLARLRAPYRDEPMLDVANPRAMRLPHGVSIACGSLIFLAVYRVLP